ncbi:MAG TPA: serine hydrolase domain-containing protein [Sediminibacterium sp.]|nr:serine hydrolase domain-containing protein [Sediminibacterium sp.]
MSLKFKVFCVNVSMLILSLLNFQSIRAQYNFTELDQKVESVKKELGGEFSLLIYHNGQVVYNKSEGGFTPKTQAPVASCSKWLTAALILVLANEGKLSLNDRISKYLPTYSKYSKGYITIGQCLSHLTGIASEPIRLATFLKRGKYNSLEEEVADFASGKDIISNPGLEFRYSNIGLNIAGRIAEIVSRKGFEQVMQEKLLRPLQMRNTSFSSLNAVNPSGGAVSTPNDYMNFLSMLLNKGMYNGKRILSESAVALLHTPQTTAPMIKYAPKMAEGFNYGMGEWIQETDENGNATVVSCPGLFGTWPLLDLCRGYASIVFVKSLLTEEKRAVYMDLKKVIDRQIVANCK